MPSVDVRVSELADRTVITVVGDLDLDACSQVTRITDTVNVRDRILCLDMAGVAFMDASGLCLLQTLNRNADTHGGHLELSGLQAQPQHVLDLTGTRPQFRVTTPRPPGPRAAAVLLPAHHAAS
ncbi:STAS domain-containing protein [Streptomyces sp. IBSBF 3136]|uniref:STAS domain-containing protein n=1 Tax=Streptomyces sp. IBSBF 3136 TaxID=2903524 RepID=UPI002FDBCADE